MKKVTKENPLTHFRKANEARQKTVKASMKKMQEGGGPSEPGPGQVYESIKEKYRKKIQEKGRSGYNTPRRLIFFS